MLDLMIVDDEKMVVNDLVNLIDWQASGFNIVAQAYNGKSALEKFSRLKPDVVITDIVMPVMKGIDLLRQIKMVAPATIVILISSYSEFAYVKEALDLGAFGYLLKDEINAKSLLALLAKVKINLQSAAETVNPFASIAADSSSSAALQKSFAYMICEIDQPFPLAEMVCQEKVNPSVFHSAEIQFVRDIVYEQINVHHVFVVSGSRLILELSVNRKCGQHLQLRECLHLFAKYLQREIGDRFSRTVSIFLINELLNQQGAREFYQRYESSIRNRIFWGSGLIIDLTDDRLARIGALQVLDSAELATMIKRKNRDKLLSQIEHHFQDIVSRRDFNGFFGSLESLVNLIDLFSHEAGQSPLKISARHDSSRTVANIGQCQQWLINEIDKLLDDLDAAEKYSHNVQKTINYIRENFADKDLGLNDIADAVALSPTHLGFLFKKETGVTINHFITTVRMDQAMEMLRSADCKMYEIAGSVGYRSSQYFSQVFTKHVGCMPKEYHRAYGKQ
ncbi:MAG TPA: hypothetical protein DCM45_00620, partial [Clostridiales bacterium]|nr:hypothetical protein [Clostridiales bacterium]